MAEPAAELPPLPKALADAVQQVLGPGRALSRQVNPGLVFERYPRCWTERAGSWGLGEGRRVFIQRFAEGYESLRTTFEPLLNNRRETLERGFGEGRTYEACWRFVTGIGSEHPLENGFTFHRLLGVPFFPGSTVKGLTRVAARLSGIGGDEDRRFFGSAIEESKESRKPDQAGGVVFLEALPDTWPKLGVDLINNHRPTWTALLGTGSQELTAAHRASAAGLEDPVPVYFLVVEPGVSFRFWIRPRAGSGLSAEELSRVWEWLELGLGFLGIGAKTAVGYGRFEPEGSRPSPPPSPPPKPPRVAPPSAFKKGDRVRFVLSRLSKKGKWQGHLADHPDSFGTLLGDPPPDAEAGKEFEVMVAAPGDLKNLNLRWP
jgi:CRISPR type III-B/RAMP module RAMP protein Cmr6